MENIATGLQGAAETLAAWMSAVLFYNIGGFPFIVLWLAVAAVFFTIYLRGVNFQLFGHALRVATGRFDRSGEPGEVRPIQALCSALAATVGLGSIAGISVGVAIGGPGAVIWIVLAGLLGMATKFAEVTLSMRYRQIDAYGKVYGGPFHYLEAGLRSLGKPRAGRALALLFAVFCLGGAIGGGNMFQSNQAVTMLSRSFAPLAELRWLLSLLFAVLVGVVLTGSIKRIAKVADVIVPAKGLTYLACAIVVVVVHRTELWSAMALMFHEAFSAHAAAGGFIGMIAVSFKRANFANEAGLGSAPIAHAAAKTDEPVREASLALLEPFFAAIIAFLTGLMVVISGAYNGAKAEDGVLIAAHAFASVSDWFPAMLAINVLLFAYSTTIGWSYYGEIAWSYLFGRRMIRVYYALFCVATFAGGIMHFGVVLDLSDLFILGMSLPNIIALYLLRKEIKSELDRYRKIYLR